MIELRAALEALGGAPTCYLVITPRALGGNTHIKRPSCSLVITPGEAAAFERGLERVLSSAMAELPVDALLARAHEAHAARRAAMLRWVTPTMAILSMAVLKMAQLTMAQLWLSLLAALARRRRCSSSAMGSDRQQKRPTAGPPQPQRALPPPHLGARFVGRWDS